MEDFVTSYCSQMKNKIASGQNTVMYSNFLFQTRDHRIQPIPKKIKKESCNRKSLNRYVIPNSRSGLAKGKTVLC